MIFEDIETFKMVGVLGSGSKGLGSNPGREDCAVFMGKTLALRSPSKLK